MTAKKYSDRYALALNYQKVAELAFTAGLKQGREEKKTDKIRKLELDLKRYKEYHDDMEKTLYDPEKLSDLIGGL